MTFLLDTNVVSEVIKPAPAVDVERWLGAVDEDFLHLSVVTLGEVRRGIEKLSPGARRHILEAWLSEQLLDRFGERILSVDYAVADVWGRVVARSEAQGRRLDSVDALIAATALAHDLTVVTRNGKDFEPAGVRVVDPWMN